MLRQLHIQNLALVDDVQIDLDPGFNVLTGETGAGKSILVGALDLLLGGRSQTGSVREGASEALVEALFSLPPALQAGLEAQGLAVPEGELLVRRRIPRSGRARVHLNGQLSTVRSLAGLRQVLDLTSQHEHVSLLKPERHLSLLDDFGGLQAEAAAVAAAFEAQRGAARALAEAQRGASSRAQREDYLRFALEELETVAPEPGELAQLEAERRRLSAAQGLLEGAREAELRLYSGDGAVVEVLGRVEASLGRLAALDPGLSPLAGAAGGLLAELEELARGLSGYQRGLESQPGRLQQVEDRLAELRRLLRKYGGDEARALQAWAELRAELEGWDQQDSRLDRLQQALDEAEAALVRQAQALSEARRGLVRRLERSLLAELRQLSLPKARLRMQLTPLTAPGAHGAEQAELRFCSNPGEPLYALSQVASGGELSRVLIAIKRVLAGQQGGGSYVFDEVDTGIGGAVGDVVGAKLAQIAQDSQVIAVTHLAPVAAYATAHFKVCKRQRRGRTVTEVRRLSEGEQLEELARMVGGAEITARTRGLAAELRASAQGRPLALVS